jgi:type IV secretory pathway VirB9-like protein
MMTEIQHTHVQRDLAALKAAEEKLAAAAEKAMHAKQVHEDAKRAYDSAVSKFHGTIESTKALRMVQTPNGHWFSVDPAKF